MNYRLLSSAGHGIFMPFIFSIVNLDDKQVPALGRIVEKIRVEREQAAVDLRRAGGEYADALESHGYQDDPVVVATRRRVVAATSVQEVVTRSLRELHDLLDAEQRAEFPSLIRTGAVKL